MGFNKGMSTEKSKNKSLGQKKLELKQETEAQGSTSLQKKAMKGVQELVNPIKQGWKSRGKKIGPLNLGITADLDTRFQWSGKPD